MPQTLTRGPGGSPTGAAESHEVEPSRSTRTSCRFATPVGEQPGPPAQPGGVSNRRTAWHVGEGGLAGGGRGGGGGGGRPPRPAARPDPPPPSRRGGARGRGPGGGGGGTDLQGGDHETKDPTDKFKAGR